MPIQFPVVPLAHSLFPFNPSLADEMKRLFSNFGTSQTSSFLSAEAVREEFRHNGQDYEYCPELENHELPVVGTRRKKNKKAIPAECVFCKNNGEEPIYYKRHILKDVEGIVRCPVLRAYTCPICGVNGDSAHTIKYCPLNKNDDQFSLSSLKVLRNSTGKRRSK